MTTSPFAPAVHALIRESHRQELTAAAHIPNGSGYDTLALDVQDYSISWDEDSTPRVMANLQARVGDQDTLDSLDPRTGARVIVTASYQLPDGSMDTHQVADLCLRSRRVSRPDNTMTLICASDEALYIDAAPSVHFFDGQTTHASAAAAVETWVAAMAAAGPASGDVVVTTNRDDGTFDADTFPTDKWNVCRDAADSIDADLFDNGDRVLRLAPRRYLVAASALALTVGVNGTIVTSEALLDREDWHNGVLILWEWENDGTAPNKRWGQAYVDTGPYRPAVAGDRIHAEQRDGWMSATRATTTATTVLRRHLARARTYTLETVSAWWVRPGDTVTVQLPTGDQERHLVSRITHTTGGAMRLTTRLPDNESTIGE